MYLKDRKTKMKYQSQFFLHFLANQTHTHTHTIHTDI